MIRVLNINPLLNYTV